jgi:hypothetical protein
MDGWMDGWMDGCMDGWMDGCMDGWMDGWIDAYMYVWACTFSVLIVSHLIGWTHLDTVRHVCDTHPMHCLGDEPAPCLHCQHSHHRLQQLRGCVCAEELCELAVLLPAVARVSWCANAYYTDAYIERSV